MFWIAGVRYCWEGCYTFCMRLTLALEQHNQIQFWISNGWYWGWKLLYIFTVQQKNRCHAITWDTTLFFLNNLHFLFFLNVWLLFSCLQSTVWIYVVCVENHSNWFRIEGKMTTVNEIKTNLVKMPFRG